jgi:hypothetical protein
MMVHEVDTTTRALIGDASIQVESGARRQLFNPSIRQATGEE